MSRRKKSAPLPKAKLSSRELDLMREVWEIGRVSVTELMTAVNRRTGAELSRTTIQVLIQRLVEKGWLAAEKTGRRFFYSATVSHEKASTELVMDLQRKLFDGSSVDLIRTLVTGDEISREEVDELRALIDAAARPEEGGA